MAGCRSAVAVVACVVLMIAALAQCATARHLVVGAPYRWSAQGAKIEGSSFFQNWAHGNSPFHTTDELEFKWNTPDSVLQVDFTAFTACDSRNPIKAWPANPDGEILSMVFPLQAFKFQTLHFISGDMDDCTLGVKVSIDVLE